MNFKNAFLCFFYTIFLCSVIYSCSSALYEPDSKNVKNGTLLSELKEGREIYIRKCSSCHNLHLPEKYSESEWDHWLEIMAKKAQLTKQEELKVYKYVTMEKK
ncbi:hypothetical protein D4R20_00705 [bacterium]|nr:MAG: hypothetical protein D4R20_00705 [bacterium]